MNEWVRQALTYASDAGDDLSYDEIANALTIAKVGGTYDKSKVQKMTIGRKVSLLEAQVISQLTKFPLPQPEQQATSLDERAARLSVKRQQRLLEMLADLEAAEAVDPEVGS